MKNRFIKIITFSLMLTGISWSCSDWLELYPEDSLVSEEYWKSGSDVEAMLANTYGKLARQAKTILLWGELRGGLLSEGTNVPSDPARIMRGDVTDLNSLARWSNMYTVINGANQIIAFAPDVVERDPSFTIAELNRTMSEAYFLRALSYFYLVRTFKEVPLITDPYVSDEQNYYPYKSTEAETIQQILSDLQQAIARAVPSFETLSETKGRATAYAIHSLMADVYLWNNDYANAIAHCDHVINSGHYALLAENLWFQNFYPGNSNSSIFELQFSQRWNYNANLYQTFSYSKNREYMMNPRMLEMFDQQDVRGLGATYTADNLEVWKYVGINPETERGDALNDNNFIIYRLADIMLLKSEALIQLGRFDEAKDLVNAIRQRRGVQAIDPEPALEAYEDLILNERARELAFEGKYWYDLVRMGKRDEYRKKQSVIIALIMNATADEVLPLTAKFQDPNSWYMPIHREELERNSNLVQNPYYQN